FVGHAGSVVTAGGIARRGVDVTETLGGCVRSRVRIALLFLICGLSAGAANYYVTVAGLGGLPEYEAQFAKWAADLEKQLQGNGSDARVVTLSGNAATRQQVEQALSRAASEVAPADAFALFLIGHGTFDGTDYKINLP